MEGCIAALHLHLAPFEGIQIDETKVEDIGNAWRELCILDVMDGIECQVEVKQVDGFLHDTGVTDNEWATSAVNFVVRQ